MMKARLTLQIYHIISERDLTPVQAAKALGIRQPHMSLLIRNRAGSFSGGRLMQFLTALARTSRSPSGPPTRNVAKCP